jgi:excisionase family DNA binding protein
VDDLTLAEAAAILGVTATTLRVDIHRGRLVATKRGRDWFVSPEELDRQLIRRGKLPRNPR